MHVRHLLHERGKVAVALRPEDPVPGIRKQAGGANPHPARPQRLLDNPLESQEVLVLFEKRPSADASIQNMINHAAREMA
jgi:hypothetical protein